MSIVAVNRLWLATADGICPFPYLHVITIFAGVLETLVIGLN